MNKKGFTLVELMGVIILLGVLSLIATITVTNTIKESKLEGCNMQLVNIKSAAENWASKNWFNLPNEEGASITITLSDLKSGGFIDKDITNPVTGELFSDSIMITITKLDNSYKYEVGEEC